MQYGEGTALLHMDEPVTISVTKSGAHSLAAAGTFDRCCCLWTLLLARGTRTLFVLTASGFKTVRQAT